jgi:hypothetical protein
MIIPRVIVFYCNKSAQLFHKPWINSILAKVKISGKKNLEVFDIFSVENCYNLIYMYLHETGIHYGHNICTLLWQFFMNKHTADFVFGSGQIVCHGPKQKHMVEVKGKTRIFKTLFMQ